MSSNVSELLNKYVAIPAERLYRDSYGEGPGRIQPAGIYKVNHVREGGLCPIHICSDSGDLGWIKNNATLATPPK
jgi:hypothetical protein